MAKTLHMQSLENDGIFRRVYVEMLDTAANASLSPSVSSGMMACRISPLDEMACSA
jgi:hypothetical protein